MVSPTRVIRKVLYLWRSTPIHNIIPTLFLFKHVMILTLSETKTKIVQNSNTPQDMYSKPYLKFK